MCRNPPCIISIVETRKLVVLGGNFAINGCLGSNCWRKVNKHRSFSVGSEYLCIHLLFPRQIILCFYSTYFDYTNILKILNTALTKIAGT